MVKLCEVISRNAINMVVSYDGNLVQLPTDNEKSLKVYVKKEDNKYSITSKNECERPQFSKEPFVKKENSFENKQDKTSEQTNTKYENKFFKKDKYTDDKKESVDEI